MFIDSKRSIRQSAIKECSSSAPGSRLSEANDPAAHLKRCVRLRPVSDSFSLVCSSCCSANAEAVFDNHARFIAQCPGTPRSFWIRPFSPRIDELHFEQSRMVVVYPCDSSKVGCRERSLTERFATQQVYQRASWDDQRRGRHTREPVPRIDQREPRPAWLQPDAAAIVIRVCIGVFKTPAVAAPRCVTVPACRVDARTNEAASEGGAEAAQVREEITPVRGRSHHDRNGVTNACQECSQSSAFLDAVFVREEIPPRQERATFNIQSLSFVPHVAASGVLWRQFE
jgi:hypothetical protein